MTKSKSVGEPYMVVVDKLGDEEENKPDTIIADLGSPITPLQTRLTSTSTSSSSSGSSGSFTDHAPVSTKPDSDQPAAQSKTTTPSSAAHSPGSVSATQSGSNSPANATSGSTSPAGAKTGPNSPKAPTRTGNTRLARKNSTSPVKILPGGNLFPSGKVQITGMTQGIPKNMVLGPAAAKSYGYGSVFRGSGSGNSFSQAITKPTTSGCSSLGSPVAAASRSSNVPDQGTLSKKVVTSSNPEEIKEKGNEMYKKGSFAEALKLYDQAIELSPSNAAYHSNRAAALSSLGRIGEAVNECYKAIKLDPKFIRAHHRLASLLLRLGHVDNAGKHFFAVEEPSDPTVVKMLQLVDKHLNKCTYARRRGEWNFVLTEVSAAIKYGADCSPQLAMCKVEALLKLLRLDDAQTELASVPKVEPFPASLSQTRFFGMICEAYTCFVKSQLELALGRFANAVTSAERASEIDPKNSEVEMLYRNVRLIARACNRGYDLYESERYTEASAAYGEGLKFDTSNVTLLRQRADCFFKIGMWESSVEDCNHALLILPGYMEPLRQRAASYFMLERWAEAVRDYETLRKELPYDKEIAESLFHAQVALKKSCGEVVLDMEFGGEVEEIFSPIELKAALTRPGVSIVFFTRASDQQCKEMSVFVDALCVRYLSLHFLKVEIEKHPGVGDAEKVRVVPTFKIYKLGTRIKEIVCPSKETLENSVRHYSL